MQTRALLFLSLILAVFAVSTTTRLAAQIPQPLLYLNFEGADPWQDQSDTANPVSVSGNVLGVPTGAPNGPSPSGGASFAGGHLKLPGIHSLNDLQQYTMVAWLKPDRDNDGAERYVFGQESQGIHNGIRNNMFLHHAHWGSDQNGGTDLKGYFANTATDGWVHATWTWDATSRTGQIYLDGVLDGQWDKNPPNVGNAMIIGGRNGGTEPYRGIMDEVAIWNSVLSPGDIADLADGATPVDAADEDEDTLPDWWERKYANDLTTLNGLAGDFDEDGLSDYDEFENGTDPTEEDTDADGLEDNVETNTGTFASATDT
ncbi:MAG: LamG-like jellyroll fold domain-containing protein, partial [Verrucomicrobiota bacterium]|nr:LamG-like jellyroll fold domain-containing protein [Verrucomicrobiota bacterium]